MDPIEWCASRQVAGRRVERDQVDVAFETAQLVRDSDEEGERFQVQVGAKVDRDATQDEIELQHGSAAKRPAETGNRGDATRARSLGVVFGHLPIIATSHLLRTPSL